MRNCRLYRKSILVLIVLILLLSTSSAFAQTLDDYTAYPPFLRSPDPNNVLLVMDHSGSMQFPAYTGCDFTGYSSNRAMCGTSDSLLDSEYLYDNSVEYDGYFNKEKYYRYTTNKFEEDLVCIYTQGDPGYRIGDTSGCMSGNLLNWATMSRIDVIRKALIGGKSISVQPSLHTLRGEGGWRTYSDHNLGCTFIIDGGSYPNLDHKVSISEYGMYGTCGFLTIHASGTGIWGSSDSFRYVYQPISGDFDVKLRIVSPPSESGQTYAKAGLMVRESADANSAHVMVNATNGAGLQFAYRGTSGGSTNTFAGYQSSSYPVWVRLVRNGNLFTAYYSDNGTSWTNHGSVSVSMAPSVLVGMDAVSNSTSGILTSSEYDEFICDVCMSDDFDDYIFDAFIWTGIDISTTGGSQTESCGNACAIGTLYNANVTVDVPTVESRGIIQEIADKDNDGIWDSDALRFGLMIYAGDNRDGEMKVGIAGSNLSNFITALQNEAPYSGTPTGEALREANDYFRQINNYAYESNAAYIGGQGSSRDPFYNLGIPSEHGLNIILLIASIDI